MHEVNLRPHFMWSNKDEDEMVEQQQIQGKVKAERSWKPLEPDPNAFKKSYERKMGNKYLPEKIAGEGQQLLNFAGVFGTSKDNVKRATKLKDDPEVLEIHNQIDDANARMLTAPTPEERNAAQHEIIDLVRQLKAKGAVFEFGK